MTNAAMLCSTSRMLIAFSRTTAYYSEPTSTPLHACLTFSAMLQCDCILLPSLYISQTVWTFRRTNWATTHAVMMTLAAGEIVLC
jgi:hypothetical protein